MAVSHQPGPKKRIQLPDNLRLDCPRLLLKGFEQAFYTSVVTHVTDKPPLTVERILEWADQYYEKHGKWPNERSGRLEGINETWAGINSALIRGMRGLAGNRTLPQLLVEHRSKENHMSLPYLSIEQVLEWVDQHFREQGTWPTITSGQIHDTRETWKNINQSLYIGLRGLPAGSSLARLLEAHRGVPNPKARPTLTVAQILGWADRHHNKTGTWPNSQGGRIEGTTETWSGIDRVLQRGTRGLPEGSSLAQLLRDHRDVFHHKVRPNLTVEQILEWADHYYDKHGQKPVKASGNVDGVAETWGGINSALYRGNRGLPGGSSLAQLLLNQRAIRPHKGLPDITVEQILKLSDQHHEKHGFWPNKASGNIDGVAETWRGINDALRRGNRGLPGGSSLAQLLKKHRSG